PRMRTCGVTESSDSPVAAPPFVAASSQRPSGEIEMGVVPVGRLAARNRTSAGGSAARNVASVGRARAIAAMDAIAIAAHTARSRDHQLVVAGAALPVLVSPLAIHWSSLITSRAVWNRCCGSLLRQRLITYSSACGAAG